MAFNLTLLVFALTAVAAYGSKCPGWSSCGIYTDEELAILYYNSKYCMSLVPDKWIGNRFGSGQVRDACYDSGLNIVNFEGASKEDEAEEISNCLAKYFSISIVAPTYTCLQQALSQNISEMEKIPYTAAQKQTVLDVVDKCLEQVADDVPRAECRAEAERQLGTDHVWKANIPHTIENCLYSPKYAIKDTNSLSSTNNCLVAALEKPFSN